ncbi:MAG: YbbR-like domain-containing protein [Spirochaetales bacterium]
MEISRFLGKNAGNWSIKILALGAAVLLFFYNQIIGLEEETYSVPLQVEAADGLSPASDLPDSVRVTVRGSEESISAVSASMLSARVDATRYTEPGRYTVPVDASIQENEVDSLAVDLQVEPAAYTIELDRTARTTVEVNPAIRGFPARGFELARSFVSPQRVEIEGPERHVSSRSTIGTEEIDISARTEPFTTEVALRPPNDFISVRGGSEVDFRGVIREIMVETWFSDVEISVVDVPDEYEAVGTPGAGSVQLRGPLLRLESLGTDELSLEADASEVSEAGEQELVLEAVAPEDVEVLDFEPRRSAVVFENVEIADEARFEELLR